MARELQRIATFAVGWTLIGLGVAGLFLPILQGVLLILLGFYVLSRESRWARRQLDRLRARFPALDASLEAVKTRLPFRRGGDDVDRPAAAAQSTTTAGTNTGSSEPLSTTDA